MSAEINPSLENPAQSRVTQFTRLVREEHWLSLMLLALHGSLVLGLSDPLARALLISHFGLFLLWQPVWRGEKRLLVRQAVLTLIAGSVLVIAGSWWLMALWISVLFALIGGSMPGIRRIGQRAVSLLAALYLLSVLLMWVVPHLFNETNFSRPVQWLVDYGLMIPAALAFFIRVEKTEPQTAYALDLFYSVLLFLLVSVLVLGSFVVKQLSQGDYVIALTQTLFGIAVFLIVLSLLWDPRAGFAGIGQIITRYFLSVGLPFEVWMHSLAGIAERVSDPDEFVLLAAQEMVVLPWVSGVRWQAPGAGGEVGEVSAHSTQFSFGGLDITVYTRFSPSPALILHIRLLARLLGDYYENKVRASRERRNAYMQAIHETGARLTHDVKNLLQSLRSLCSAAETSDKDDAEAVRMLMRRQLPQIAQRLQITLDKLSSDVGAASELSPASDWWRALTQRFAYERVTFLEPDPELGDGQKLPTDLFDSVVENLLQNALHKLGTAPGVTITVGLRRVDGGCVLTVCDDGEPVSAVVAQRLFAAPVSSSKTGLGVGLYQAGRLAKERGYVLRLCSNEAGRVCFELAPVSGN